MITQQNIINHELIGLETQVIESKSNIVGMSGKIIDETKSMFIIETKNGTKMIPKQHNKWKFAIDNLEFTADGNSLSKRPEDRIKVQI